MVVAKGWMWMSLVGVLLCCVLSGEGRVMLERYDNRLQGKGLGFTGLVECNRTASPLASGDAGGEESQGVQRALREFLAQRTLPGLKREVLGLGESSSRHSLCYQLPDGLHLMVVDPAEASFVPYPFLFAHVHLLEDLLVAVSASDSALSSWQVLERHSFSIYQDLDQHWTVISHASIPIPSSSSSSSPSLSDFASISLSQLFPFQSPYLPGVDNHHLYQPQAEEEIRVEKDTHGMPLNPPLVAESASGAEELLRGEANEGLKVLCFNIWNYNLPWLERLEMIARLIREQSPDLVVLQEVRYDFFKQYDPQQRQRQRNSPEAKRGRFQIESLTALLPRYQFVYDVSMTYLEMHQGKFRTDEGLAVLSLHPIVNSSRLRLSRDLGDAQDEHQRLLQAVTVQTPHGPVQLFNTHLTLSQKARLRSAAEIWDFVSRLSVPGVPQLLMGDFNSEPDDPLLSFLVDGPGDFSDAWAQ
ncbi:MAG: endonuclease/exonuclease/phosphatase family protein, partial [archaeon]|nr:endonuclease/exonuclease/phosphatase family protein [archaeon]